ncbi:hypothetical protein M413DRAFT_438827 [Hebeloma cylindrosporum]|uniref:Uncharacterized protein n=1 Tax=Hebeloma cylindrosporum TaxID=76867 RepID=A0A0C3CZT4_HEBCY|nr:hypothetical protein M413DRAFT_438827 [Hebeloma cylindrosporum h7]
MSDVDYSPMDPLPDYVQDQLPQSTFDAVVTRIAVASSVPDARVILEGFIESQKAPDYDKSQEAEAPKPIEEYPVGPEPLTRVKQQIVKEFFLAIKREDSETIAVLIQNNLVTANARNQVGTTPLLEAISTKIIHLVKELLDFGADPNAFGVVPQDGSGKAPATRTALMYAASTGSLPIVKLLLEPPYSANEALVAPDGQIALRLASAGGHRTIVDYLPSRRAGGFLRWRTHNAAAIARMKVALRKLYHFIKFFVWDVPKIFVWNIPKHVVVLPVVRSCKWCWANRKKIGGWCKHQITEMPKRVARAGKWVWKGVKKIPKAVKATGKGLWKFGTQTLPRWIKELFLWFWDLISVRIPKAAVNVAKWFWNLITVHIPNASVAIAKWFWNLITVHIPKATVDVAKWIWNLITVHIPNASVAVAKWIWNLISVHIPNASIAVAKWIWNLISVRIPHAIVVLAKWIWSGISSLGKAAWDVVRKLVSFLHTVLQAIATFLRSLKLRDIWNGFVDVLRAIFVTIPAILLSWIQKFGEVSLEVLRALFGCFGELIWLLIDGLQWLVLYIPSKLWLILQSLLSSLARGLSEVMIWIHPKL